MLNNEDQIMLIKTAWFIFSCNLLYNIIYRRMLFTCYKRLFDLILISILVYYDVSPFKEGLIYIIFYFLYYIYIIFKFIKLFIYILFHYIIMKKYI